MEAINHMTFDRIFFDFHTASVPTPLPLYKLDTSTVTNEVLFTHVICCDVFDDHGNAELNKYLTIEEIQNLRKTGLTVLVNPHIASTWKTEVTWCINFPFPTKDDEETWYDQND